MSLNDLPILELNADLEMVALLQARLPQDLAAIYQCVQAKDYPELQRHVHKLLGAVCYCGTPRLKYVLHQLETQLKKPIMLDSLSNLINQLDTEVNQLLLE